VNLLNFWAQQPGLYGGSGFDLLLALYLVQHAWNHCLAFCPVLGKDIRPLARVAVLDMVLNVALSVWFVRLMGVKGVLLGSMLGGCASTIYLTWRAPGHVSLTPGKLVLPFLRRWSVMAACGALAFACFRFTDLNGNSLWLRGLFCVLTLAVFLILHRDEVVEFLSRGRRFSFLQK
jgi:peptidoglycan biosynthesis protein MviN/MurJ (putative lipid II flippase)